MIFIYVQCRYIVYILCSFGYPFISYPELDGIFPHEYLLFWILYLITWLHFPVGDSLNNCMQYGNSIFPYKIQWIKVIGDFHEVYFCQNSNTVFVKISSWTCKNDNFVFKVGTYSIGARDLRFVNRIPSFAHESRLSLANLQSFVI